MRSFKEAILGFRAELVHSKMNLENFSRCPNGSHNAMMSVIVREFLEHTCVS